jgi:hypothetical protein
MVENNETLKPSPKPSSFDARLAMLAKGSLQTKALVDQLPELLKDYEKKLMDAATHRSENSIYLASIGSDCSAVKDFMAGLTPPEERTLELATSDASPVKKKTTAAEKEAWRDIQRTENKALYALVQRQNSVFFITEADKVAIEIALQRIQNARIVLTLKTAQMNFLAGGD